MKKKYDPALGFYQEQESGEDMRQIEAKKHLEEQSVYLRLQQQELRMEEIDRLKEKIRQQQSASMSESPSRPTPWQLARAATLAETAKPPSYEVGDAMPITYSGSRS